MITVAGEKDKKYHDKDKDDDRDKIELRIKKAEYKKEKQRLEVKIKVKGIKKYQACLYDAVTRRQLVCRESDDDSLKFRLEPLTGSEVPCSVEVRVGDLSDSREVKHAPENCSAGSPPPPPPPPAANQPPDCRIVAPAADPVQIALGDAVDFAGSASDPEGGPLTYEWDFSGGADARPAVLDPAPVTFDRPGRFHVHFYVTDDHGNRCDATRTVIVGNPPPTTGMVPQQPAPGEPGSGDGNHVVLPFNDLGMHCADLRSYPFSVLPPFNTVNAHALRRGSEPQLLDGTVIELRYSAASNPNDPVGPNSINSTSQNYPVGASADAAQIVKSDFWDVVGPKGESNAELLFGLPPGLIRPDEGLPVHHNTDHGRYMPGIDAPYSANDPQAFSAFVAEHGWFTAEGIPMTPVDDQGRFNAYPLLRVQMVDKASGSVLATTDVVTPVSYEVDCRDCHTQGKVGADPNVWGNIFQAPASADRADIEMAAKHNILALHDAKHGTDLLSSKPVLCAGCHRSNALAAVGGPQGDPTLPSMSEVAHGFHGRLQLAADGSLLRDADGNPVLIEPNNRSGTKPLIPVGPDVPMEQNCFLCHPGKVTQCFRGAMFTAGRKCSDCHGDLLAVGGLYPLKDKGAPRTPWADEPRCGSCHGGIGGEPVRTVAYDPNDPAATPLPPLTSRFAENPGTLYRDSHGHGGLGCESCHGSPHAIWPNRNPNANDNVTAVQLQGHKGTLMECSVCHTPGSFPKGTLDGPHGMHPVNDPVWNKKHGDFYEHAAGDPCATCHGDDHLGTRLSKTPVDRVLKDKKGKVLATLKAGDQVACNLCHSLEKSFDH
ncbi:MAG TPA: carboxypeptidase regulatory-like domain-containing protein [Methylothermaceae bacterium]|nr:carboxypeptidase regulatory-like domain-containing protein [Methylothermaceae bacterium]